jgi:hypothetical protein
VQLVVQSLLGDLVLGDQPAPVPDRGGQGILDLIGDPTALALAGQVGQRGAVAVVGLEAPRAQLRARRSGLRRREQPHRSGKALAELPHPGLMQPTAGLDGEHLTRGPDVIDDQPVQPFQPRPKHRQRQRRHHFAGLTGAQPDPVADLPRIDRHHQRRRRQRLLQQAHDNLPSTAATSSGRCRRDGSTAISSPAGAGGAAGPAGA